MSPGFYRSQDKRVRIWNIFLSFLTLVFDSNSFILFSKKSGAQNFRYNFEFFNTRFPCLQIKRGRDISKYYYLRACIRNTWLVIPKSLITSSKISAYWSISHDQMHHCSLIFPTSLLLDFNYFIKLGTWIPICLSFTFPVFIFLYLGKIIVFEIFLPTYMYVMYIYVL